MKLAIEEVLAARGEITFPLPVIFTPLKLPTNTKLAKLAIKRQETV